MKDYINKNKKKPSNRDKNKDIKRLSEWLTCQQTNYNKEDQNMKNENIRKLYEEFIKEYEEYFISNEELWKAKLVQVKEYINKNKKRPSNKDKNNEIKRLGEWLSGQQKNYKKECHIMKDDIIKKQYEEFMKEYEEYFISNEELWEIKLEQVKEYINKYKKRPSCSDKNNEINQVGHWLSTQQINYRKKGPIMENDNIRKLYEEFMKEYEEYFISNEELWEIKLEQVKEYINKYKKRPSCSDKNNEINQVGHWLSTQQINYRKKGPIMENDNIRKLYEEFMKEYEEYFISNEDLWKFKLKKN